MFPHPQANGFYSSCSVFKPPFPPAPSSTSFKHTQTLPRVQTPEAVSLRERKKRNKKSNRIWENKTTDVRSSRMYALYCCVFARSLSDIQCNLNINREICRRKTFENVIFFREVLKRKCSLYIKISEPNGCDSSRF